MRRGNRNIQSVFYQTKSLVLSNKPIRQCAWYLPNPLREQQVFLVYNSNMKLIAIVLLLCLTQNCFSQDGGFPLMLPRTDTLIISIKESGCFASRETKVRIVRKEKDTFLVAHVSLHMTSYFFEKNRFYRDYKEEAKDFLKQNALKLGKIYSPAAKPSNTVKGSSYGLNECRIMVEEVDSTKTITANAFNQIVAFYTNIKSGNIEPYTLQPERYLLCAIGDATVVTISLIEKDKPIRQLLNKRFSGWFDFGLFT